MYKQVHGLGTRCIFFVPFDALLVPAFFGTCIPLSAAVCSAGMYCATCILLTDFCTETVS